MKVFFSILLFAFMTAFAFAEQGTMSTDDTIPSQSEASMSGTDDEEIVDPQAMEERGFDRTPEEVQIDEDSYDPAEIDQERMDEYNEEVQY